MALLPHFIKAALMKITEKLIYFLNQQNYNEFTLQKLVYCYLIFLMKFVTYLAFLEALF